MHSPRCNEPLRNTFVNLTCAAGRKNVLITKLSFLCISTISFIENVALRGKATQSSRYLHAFGGAYNAIDGNRESHFHSGSCTHSAEETNPWWRVDLLDSYVVTSITITNRGDCCEQRISGLQIHIGNSLKDNGASNPMWVIMKNEKTFDSQSFAITTTGPMKERTLTYYGTCFLEVETFMVYFPRTKCVKNYIFSLTLKNQTFNKSQQACFCHPNVTIGPLRTAGI